VYFIKHLAQTFLQDGQSYQHSRRIGTSKVSTLLELKK
jgi:hypothetical protein